MYNESLILQYSNYILSKKDKEKAVQEVISEINRLDITVGEKFKMLDQIADLLEERKLFLFEQQIYDYITMMRSASERLKKLEASAKSSK